MSLAELFVEDDLDVSVNPDTYQDQTNPPPPLPGTYRLVALGKLEQRKDKAGVATMVDGRFPIFTLMRAKIVEPVESEKEFAIFHDIRTKPFDRYGESASDVGDIVRSMDQTRGWSGLREGVGLLEEMIDQNVPFTIQGAWSAYDAAYVEAAFGNLGIAKGKEKDALKNGIISKEAYGAIYKKARLVTNDFKPDGKGGRINVAHGPSGATLEARFQIKKFIPSLTVAKLGPYPVK